MINNSFNEWVILKVLPLQKNNPSWHRLDGRLKGGNRSVVARFRYAGRVWKVHGDTRIEPVLRAYKAMASGILQDSFVIQRTKKDSRDCLDLATLLKDPDQPKYFYVYE